MLIIINGIFKRVAKSSIYFYVEYNSTLESVSIRGDTARENVRDKERDLEL